MTDYTAWLSPSRRAIGRLYVQRLLLQELAREWREMARVYNPEARA